MADFGKKKFIWKIQFTTKNIIRFVFFCFFAIQIVGFFTWAIVYKVQGVWTSNNNFLIAFPILLILIDFLIMRKILIKSQPKD